MMCHVNAVLHADDSSVFDTSLSEEYAIAAASFGLTEAQLEFLAGSSSGATEAACTCQRTQCPPLISENYEGSIAIKIAITASW